MGNESCSGWATGGALHSIPTIDFERVYVMGYSLGGNVALHAAALDSRVKGVPPALNLCRYGVVRRCSERTGVCHTS